MEERIDCMFRAYYSMEGSEYKVFMSIVEHSFQTKEMTYMTTKVENALKKLLCKILELCFLLSLIEEQLTNCVIVRELVYFEINLCFRRCPMDWLILMLKWYFNKTKNLKYNQQEQ